MSLPLYREQRSNQNHPLRNVWSHRKMPQMAHGGLVFDRYMPDFNTGDKEKLKKEIVETLDGHKAGNPAELLQTIDELMTMVTAIRGEARVYANNWHFMSGMGLPHVLENGMAWHHTLAVPYLPGASVKGLTRAAFEKMVSAGKLPKEKIFEIFGTDETAKEHQDKHAGKVIFFDALPVEPVTLKGDVMTPHYGDWYAEGHKPAGKDGKLDPQKIPADWHSPIPVFFLTTRAVKLLFAVAPRPGANISTQDFELTLDGLDFALRELGAGAKTAAGYGRFLRDKAAEAKLSEEQKKLREHRKGQQQQSAQRTEKERAERKAAEEAEQAAAAVPESIRGYVTEAHLKFKQNPGTKLSLHAYMIFNVLEQDRNTPRDVLKLFATEVLNMLKADGEYEEPRGIPSVDEANKKTKRVVRLRKYL